MKPIPDGPKLAIVTPTFNRGALLKRLHESLLAQDIALDWVHIVVDDGSEDDSDTRHNWRDSSHLVFVKNRENHGPLVSRNTAIDIAVEEKADLIAFIDDDDYVTQAFFPYIKRIWKDIPGVGWYISRCKFVGPVNQEKQPWPDHDGFFDYACDMQLDPKFTSDVLHVVSTARLGKRRFSRFGRYQREWTLLSKLARDGKFYASNDCLQVREYLPTGLTNSRRGRAPDLISTVNYVQRSFTILTLAPFSVRAWHRFFRQLLAFPVRVVLFLFRPQ